MKPIRILIATLITTSFIISSCDPIGDKSTSAIDTSWKCVETHSEDGTHNYYVDIEYKQGDSSTIYIYNFLNLDQNVNTSVYAKAYISGFSITLPQQTIDGHSVNGSGAISPDYNSIRLDFTDDIYGGNPANVTAELTRY